MITVKELQEKSEKSFYKIVSRYMKGETIFPWIIPSDKKIMGSNFTDWKNDLIPLHQNSKSVKETSYTVDWKDKIVNGSKQTVPAKIYFETIEDYLHFIKRKKEYDKIISARDEILNQHPSLKDWTNNHPKLLLNYSDSWSDILKVCSFFLNNTPPYQYYIRELPIEVHTKFIETHTPILKTLLNLILPGNHINEAHNDFAGRYGLRKVDVYTQIRILDELLKPHLGYDECSLKLEDAAWLNWIPDNVFIIENQVCFLTFPKVKNSVAIFGEGFKSRLSQHIPWLNKTNLYCSFDLDSAGFEMLNMIRNYYPEARSILMDEETYRLFENFSVSNPSRSKILPNLNEGESRLYTFLVAKNKRLEQEKIPQLYVQEKIHWEAGMEY